MGLKITNVPAPPVPIEKIELWCCIDDVDRLTVRIHPDGSSDSIMLCAETGQRGDEEYRVVNLFLRADELRSFGEACVRFANQET